MLASIDEGPRFTPPQPLLAAAAANGAPAAPAPLLAVEVQGAAAADAAAAGAGAQVVTVGVQGMPSDGAFTIDPPGVMPSGAADDEAELLVGVGVQGGRGTASQQEAKQSMQSHFD